MTITSSAQSITSLTARTDTTLLLTDGGTLNVLGDAILGCMIQLEEDGLLFIKGQLTQPIKYETAVFHESLTTHLGQSSSSVAHCNRMDH